jgi:hypothetical protein
MANTLQFYNSGFLGFFNGSIDWDSATNVAAILVDDTYTFSASHSTYNDVDDYEIDDEDYSAIAVGSRSTALDDGNSKVKFTCAALSWGSNVTIAAKGIVLVMGNPASLSTSDPLIGFIDFGEEKSSTDSTFSFTPHSNGLVRVALPA